MVFSDPAFWRAGALSTITIMSIVLIMLTIVENVFGGVSFIEYRRMRLDIEGAHDCCKALLFLGGQWGTCRELPGSASVARSNEMQRMGTGFSNQAESRNGAVRVISAGRAMHRITLALSALPRRRDRRRGRILPRVF